MKTRSAGPRDWRRLPLVPLRDMVVFPHMMAPFVVGRESSIRALEAALATPGQAALPGRAEGSPARRAQPEDIYDVGVVATVAQSLKLPNGHIKVMVEGVRRGRIMAFERRGELPDGRGRDASPQARRTPRASRTTWARCSALFEQYAKLSHHLAFEGLAASLKIDDPDRFADTLSAHLAVATAEKQALLEAESSVRAAAEAPGPAGGRDREGQHRPPDQRQGQEADGEGPEGVLPQREDQGHPPGARAQGRPHRRGRGAQEEDRDVRHAQGGPREGRAGAAAAGGDAAGLGRGDGLAQLHRVARGGALEEGLPRVQGPDARREDPERRPLRPREGQGADPRVPGRAPARPEDEGLDHLLRRPSGRRQDLARQVDRPRR